jgi:Protein of unknown function (DUF2568)
MRSTALLVRFLLELAALAALVAAGVGLIGGVLGWLIGLLAAAVAAVMWGLFVAPRARIALPTRPRMAVEVAVFLVATLGLFAAGWPVLGGLLIGIYLFDRMALWAVGAPAFEKDPMRRGG